MSKLAAIVSIVAGTLCTAVPALAFHEAPKRIVAACDSDPEADERCRERCEADPDCRERRLEDRRVLPEGCFLVSEPHGSVGELFPVRESGPTEERFDLVLLAEGYTDSAADQEKFETDARAFADALLGDPDATPPVPPTPPFDACASAINIWGVRVSSADSRPGIDDPEQWHVADDAGERGSCSAATGKERNTYFNATNCWQTERFNIIGDGNLMEKVANDKLGCGKWEAAMLLANSEAFAGRAAAPFAATYTGEGWQDIAIHEFAHAAFDLADEYCERAGPRPASGRAEGHLQPNVTFQADRALVKWKDLIRDTTPVPTSHNSDAPLCMACDTDPEGDPCRLSDPEPWCFEGETMVGLFEGAAEGRCEAFRPTYRNCKMHVGGSDFCPVCSRAIVDGLVAHFPGDRFEFNGSSDTGAFSATNLESFPFHVRHFDPRILEDFSWLRSSAERWELPVPDLTLHSSTDNDAFFIRLPDPTRPDPSGTTEDPDGPEHDPDAQHRGLPEECGDITVTSWAIGSREVEETVLFSGAFIVNATGNLAGESITFPGAESEGPPLSKAVPCPREAGRESISFNLGLPEGWRTGDPLPRRLCLTCPCRREYDLRLEYGVAIQRIPQSNWLRALIELEEVAALPCSGGFFPACGEPGIPFGPFGLAHPYLDIPRNCQMDGCPDHYPLWWEGTAAFDVIFTSNVDLTFELLDVNQKIVGAALPIGLIPLPFDAAFNFTPSGDLSTSPAASSAEGAIQKRLFIPELAAGFYVLVVTGLEASYSVEFTPPPPAADSDGDGIVDPFDPCPADSEDIDGFRDADGCPDPAIDIKPGSDRNSINPFSRGVIPVAILGADIFDVTDVDVTTLAFGPSGAAPKHKKGGHLEDVDDDGLMDLVSHYPTQETGIAAGVEEACVTGDTIDGIPFAGCDSVSGGRVTECSTAATWGCRVNGVLGPCLGTPGSDVILGTPGKDVIDGRGGDDYIHGFEKKDLLCGGGGQDVLIGGRGADSLYGENGDDILEGLGGRDTLDGGPGNDKLDGGRGRDTCTDPNEANQTFPFQSCEN